MVLLFLIGLGTASVKAQVRIGGNAAPQGAAVLDLNADNTVTPAGNKGALALPRVSLANNTAQLNSTTPITGMLVYNTNATLGVGIYYWNGTNWLPISGDDVIGNEVTNATSGGGLTRAGSGTAASPYTLGIATGGVTAAMLASGAANDADYIIGNEVTDATTNGGLVRTGSGTAASPFTLGVAPGGITLAMLSAGAPNVSIPIYVNGSWHYLMDTILVNINTGSSAVPPNWNVLPLNSHGRCAFFITSYATTDNLWYVQTFVSNDSVYWNTPRTGNTVGLHTRCWVLR